MNRPLKAGAVVTAFFVYSQVLLSAPASAITDGYFPSEIGSTATSTSAIVPLLAKTRDDWELATELFGSAKAGDRNAQYQLFAVIDDCETLMGYYFTRNDTPLTLAEGIAKAANASQKAQAQDAFVHCHRFPDHNVALEIGSAEYWLNKATENGQAVAQAITARNKLDEDARNTAVPLASNPAAGISISIASGAPPDRRAVDLLRAGVKSLDPQVLAIIGNEQTSLHGSRMAETVDRYAWIYVACQHGLNCSATSHWATDCPTGCDVSTPEGIIMAWSREEWPAVKERASELNAKLNAGKWNDLGLGHDCRAEAVDCHRLRVQEAFLTI